ncbi:MAG: sigma-E factor negative regulatory protein [Gammaproteobacteria bacterium]
MNEQSKISILLDEFSGDEQSNAALNEVLGDVNLQNCLHRYQMIGEAMRHELPERIDTEFSAGVIAKIDQLKTPAGSIQRIGRSKGKRTFWAWTYLKPVAGMAVAASVAIVSVTLWQSVNVGPQQGQIKDQVANVDQQKVQQLVNQPVQLGAVTVSTRINEGMRWKAIENAPELQTKMNAYLVNHTEYSNSMLGLIPQARVAAFDAE